MQKIVRKHFISTSAKEIVDVAKAWVAVSIAFAVLLSGESTGSFLSFFLIAAFTVGIGFLLHEMGHKIMAQHYGCFAEFRSFDFMLILSVIMSFFGFVFIAPGAVMICLNYFQQNISCKILSKK